MVYVCRPSSGGFVVGGRSCLNFLACAVAMYMRGGWEGYLDAQLA